MKRLGNSRLPPALLLFAAMFLRAAIPVGYMPAASNNGLLFELCPEGIPAEFMQVLSGDTQHDHGHTNHDGTGDDNHHCPIGHMLLSAAAVDDAWQAEAALVAPALATISVYSFASVSRSNYRSRGPPA